METKHTAEDGFFADKSRDDMQKLFLLEVLVDNLFIETNSSSQNLKKELSENMADTCVMFQFLHYPPLVVCESDFIGTGVSGKDTSHITFKSGKSCFFSLRTPKGPILPVPFDVKVNVVRKMKEGVLPDKLEVGKTFIDLGENFTELLKQNTDEKYCDTLPISKVKKGTFEIKDDAGKKVGSLTAFLRLSCFGKLIITQFSLNKEDEKTYLFKGTDLKEVCKNDIGQYQDRGEYPDKTKAAVEGGRRPSLDAAPLPTEKKDGYCYCNSQSDPGKGPTTTRDAPPPPQSAVMGYNVANTPPGPFLVRGEPVGNFNPFVGQGPAPTRGSMSMNFDARLGMQHSPPLFSPPPTMRGMQPPGGYLPYSQGQYQPPPGTNVQGQRIPNRGSISTGKGGGRLCDCSYPVPPDVMSKFNQRNDRNFNLGPGEVGMQDDQVIFQLPLKKPGDPLTDRDKQMDSQVYYKLTSAEETRDGVQKNTVNVKSDDIPGMATKSVSPVSGLPVDDGHDVFLLKIGKKCEGDKKRNLELELRTPKMKEPKPPMSDKDTQYLESDIPKGSGKKGSKDKGKGSKSGKGGKGGKKK